MHHFTRARRLLAQGRRRQCAILTLFSALRHNVHTATKQNKRGSRVQDQCLILESEATGVSGG